MAPQCPRDLKIGDDVVGVVICFEIENERRKSEHAQSRRREDRALEAMSCFFAQDQSAATRLSRRGGKEYRRDNAGCRRAISASGTSAISDGVNPEFGGIAV